MNDKLSATFTVQCGGCQKSVTHPYSGFWDFEYRIEMLISEEGWIRRDFGPNARVWFCGPVCAFESDMSKQIEAWWRKYYDSKRSKENFVVAMFKRLIGR